MNEKLIRSFAGHLSDEWKTPEKACNIEVFGNKMIIKSKYMHKEYLIPNLDDLDFQVITEEKKALFTTNKIDYTIFKIGEVSVPKIIVSNYELIELKSRVELFIENKRDNDERIIREEEENKRILESLRADVLINFIGLTSFISDFGYTSSYLELYSTQKNVFFRMVFELYRKADKDISEINEFKLDKYLNPQFIRNFILSNTKIVLFKSYENIYGKSAALNKIDLFRSMSLKYIKNDYLNLVESEFNKFFDDLYNDEELIEEHFALLFTYHLALTCVKIILLNRKVSTIITGELKIIIDNLNQSEIVEENYICKKVYPIYADYYEDGLFSLDEMDFNIVLKLYLNDSEEALHRFYKIYEQFLDDFEIIDKNGVSFQDLIDQIIANMDVGLFAGVDMIENCEDRGTYAVFISYLNYYLYKLMPVSHFGTIFSFDFKQLLIDKFSEKYKREYNRIERDRLLKGDLNKEIASFNDRLSFDTIITGYDFEEYLKNLLSNHGYYVEVTKKSGDQGADLILHKNNKITVVQAKFYSNPVGNKAVQEIVSAIPFYKADIGMVITNSRYTQSAIELANANSVVLIDGNDLEKMRTQILK